MDSTLGITALPYDVGGFYTGIHTDNIVSGWAGTEPWPGTEPVPPSPFPVITNLGSPVSAGMGEAINRQDVGADGLGYGGAGDSPPRGGVAGHQRGRRGETSAAPGSVFSQMALAGMAGRAMAGTTGTGGGTGHRERIGERVGAPTNKPAEPPQPEPPAPPQSPAGGPITGIAAELRELASRATREFLPTRNSPSRNGACFPSDKIPGRRPGKSVTHHIGGRRGT